jgi:hypothetical protein
MLISVLNFTTFLIYFFAILNEINSSGGENIIIIGAGIGSGGSVVGGGGDNTINFGGSGIGNGFGPLIIQGGGRQRKSKSTIIIIGGGGGGGQFGANTALVNRREEPKTDKIIHLIPYPLPIASDPMFGYGWR